MDRLKLIERDLFRLKFLCALALSEEDDSALTHARKAIFDEMTRIVKRYDNELVMAVFSGSHKISMEMVS